MFLTGQEGFKSFARGVVYVFIAVFPFLLYRGFLFNGTSTRAMNLAIIVEVLAVVLGIILFKKDTKLSIPKSPITISLILLFLGMVVASVAGVDFVTSFWSKATRTSGLFYFIHLGLFYGLLVMLFNDLRHRRALLQVFILSAALASLGALLGKDGVGVLFTNREWQGFTFGNSTFAAMYLFAAFVVSIYFAYETPKGARRWWHYFIPVVLIANPYFISPGVFNGDGVIGGAKSSSLAMFASVAMLGAAWLVSKIKSLKVRKGVIMGGVLGGIFVAVFAVHSFLSVGGLLQKEYLKQATSARPIAWSLAQSAIGDFPVFGWGVDNFVYAVEKYYDNRVMEKVNGGEAWFDRAHNVFIDQTVESGYVGVSLYVLAFLAVIGSMLYVIFYSRERNDQAFAVFITVYMVGHLMELQTAFDTTISYIPFVIMVSCATVLMHRTYSMKKVQGGDWVVPNGIKYVKAVALIVVFSSLFFMGTVQMIRAQVANGDIRTAGSSEKRIPIYPALFSSPMDKGGFLNRTIIDLQKGISLSQELFENPAKVQGMKKELDIIIANYEEYLLAHPQDYRARISLNNTYIYQRLFDVDNLDKAHASADTAIALVPAAPQAYWQHAVAYLYQRKFDLAREWAKKAYDLNPNIEESKRVLDYIERSIKTFPEIDLYNFIML